MPVDQLRGRVSMSPSEGRKPEMDERVEDDAKEEDLADDRIRKQREEHAQFRLQVPYQHPNDTFR